MALYVAGLLLLTSAIELTLALFLAVQGKLPAPATTFLEIYFGAAVALFAGGGVLMILGLGRLRAGTARPPVETTPSPPPAA